MFFFFFYLDAADFDRKVVGKILLYAWYFLCVRSLLFVNATLPNLLAIFKLFK